MAETNPVNTSEAPLLTPEGENVQVEKNDPPLEKPPSELNVSNQPKDTGLTTAIEPVVVRPKEKKTENNCVACIKRTWKAVFNCMANDKIHGSVIGPHPFSCLFCCRYFPTNCCKPWTRPFTFASLSTKLMYFIMLLLIIILSCFFIIPTPSSFKVEKITAFFPCLNRKVKGIWKDCSGHGGYFMVYRNFFALNIFFIVMAFTMINVQSTNTSFSRKKVHHGFWLYKYAILASLLLMSYLAIPVAAGGIFEVIMMYFGLICTVVFSVAQLVLILDLVEIASTYYEQRGDPRKNIIHGIGLTVAVFIDIAFFIWLCTFYSKSFDTYKDESFIETYEELQIKPRKPHSACLTNVGFFIYLIIISCFMIAFTLIRKKDLPDMGWVQVAIVIMYNLIMIWSAIESQEDLTCRPYMWRKMFAAVHLKAGNKDTFLKIEGFIHGLGALLCLYYYVFWHGPRSLTAPLSIAFTRLMTKCAKASEVPMLSDNRPTREHQEAIDRCKVWDDEQLAVTYSWSMFYVFLILGSMSICAAMTNFSDPWANYPTAASTPAFYIKIIISVISVGFYLWPVLVPKSRCILPIDV